MSSFDPAIVRKAVEEFTPRRPQKFPDPLPAKDVIVELRQNARRIAPLPIPHAALPAEEQDGHRDVLSSSARRKRPSTQTARTKEALCPRSVR